QEAGGWLPLAGTSMVRSQSPRRRPEDHGLRSSHWPYVHPNSLTTRGPVGTGPAGPRRELQNSQLRPLPLRELDMRPTLTRPRPTRLISLQTLEDRLAPAA